MRIVATIPRLREALDALSELPRGVRNKWIRIALNAAGGVLKAKAQSLAREETGLLRKSLAVKVKVPQASKNPRHHNRPAYALIGPRRKMGRPVVRNKKGRLKAITEKKAANLRHEGVKVVYRHPTRYAHLIEKGHRKRGGGRTPGYSYLGAASRTVAAQALAKAQEKIRQGLQVEAANVRAKVSSR